jgi:hypothetical protein
MLPAGLGKLWEVCCTGGSIAQLVQLTSISRCLESARWALPLYLLGRGFYERTSHAGVALPRTMKALGVHVTDRSADAACVVFPPSPPVFYRAGHPAPHGGAV